MGGYYSEPFYGGEAIPEFDFDSVFSGAVAGVAGAILGVLVIVLLLALVIGIVMYIFQSIGLYTVAKRRGIHHAWLAWIPVGYQWILGSLSDQYQYVAKGKVRNIRKVLLGLSIANVGISFFSGLLDGFSAFTAVTGAAMDTAAVSAMFSVLISLASFAVSIVLVVFMYIALYNFYESCNPSNGAMFLVLSILFSVTQPFFMFACRNKDEGMPPRKETPPPAPAQPFPIVEAQPELTPETPAEEPPVEEPSACETAPAVQETQVAEETPAEIPEETE